MGTSLFDIINPCVIKMNQLVDFTSIFDLWLFIKTYPYAIDKMCKNQLKHHTENNTIANPKRV